MQLDVFRHLWGYVGRAGESFATVASALSTIRDGGYAGVEAPLSFFPDPSGPGR